MMEQPNAANEPATTRIDTVKPPASLPEGTALARMAELTRRIVGVPKDEAIPVKKRKRH